MTAVSLTSTARLSSAAKLYRYPPRPIQYNDSVRSSAALALGKFGPDGKKAVSKLVKALVDNKDITIKESVSEAIDAIAFSDKLLKPPAELSIVPNTEIDDVWDRVSRALRVIGHDAQDAIPYLVSVLSENENYKERAGAAEAIGNIGPAARSTAPILAKVADEDDHHLVRSSAIRALSAICPDAGTVDIITKSLCEDDHCIVRSAAAYALGKIGAKAVVSMKDLAMAVSDDEDIQVRSTAEEAIKEITNELIDRRATQTINMLENATLSIKNKNSISRSAKKTLQRTIDFLKRVEPTLWFRIYSKSKTCIANHPLKYFLGRV